MMTYEKESALRLPVRRFFEAQDYTVYEEVPLLARKVDVIAKKGKKVVSVELKLHDWNRAIQQAYLNLHVSNYSFVALPEEIWSKVDPRLHYLASTNGIGLISVDGSAKLIMRARPSQIIHPKLRSAFLKKISQAHPH